MTTTGRNLFAAPPATVGRNLFERSMNDEAQGGYSGPLPSDPKDYSIEEGIRRGLIRGGSRLLSAPDTMTQMAGGLVSGIGREFDRSFGEPTVLGSGAQRVGRSLIENPGQITGYTPEIRQQLQTGMDTPRSASAEGFKPGNVRWWTENLAEQIPQLAVAVATGGAASAAGAGNAGSLLISSIPTFGLEAQDSFQATRQALQSRGVDPQKSAEAAAVLATGVGIVNSALETLPVASALRMTPLGRRLATEMAGNVGRRVLAQVGETTVAEATTEMAQELTGALAEIAASGENLSAEEWATRLGSAGLLGAGSGAAVSVGSGSAFEATRSPTMPQDRPAPQTTQESVPEAQTPSEPTLPPVDSRRTASVLQTPEGVVEYVAANPQRAATMPESPSRDDMLDFGITGKTTAEQRTAIAREIRTEYQRAVAAGEAQTTVPPVDPEEAAKSEPIPPPEDEDIQAMALPGNQPAGFSAPRHGVPIQQNVPQPITLGTIPVKGDLSEHQVITRMERDFGAPIRRGKVMIRGAAGVYINSKSNPAQVIRMLTANFGHIGVAAHEVAHHIDQTTRAVASAPANVKAELADLDYDQTERRPSEGFAEFIRYAVTHDDVTTRAPQTSQWFRQTFLPAHPKVARGLGTARAMTEKWRGQTAGQRVRANVNPTNKPRPVTTLSEGVRDKISDGWSRFYRAWVSKGDALDVMVREAKRRGVTVSDADNPAAVMSSLQLLGPHYAHQAVSGRGVISVHDRQTVLHKPLDEVLSPIRSGEYGDFVAFLYARHALEAWSKGVDPGISQADAQSVVNEHGQNQRFVEAADGITSFNNALIDMLAQTGAITTAEATAMQDYWKTYVPLARAIGRGGSSLRAATANLDNPMTGRRGADLPIIDPVLTTMRRSLHLYNRAIRQESIESLARFAEKNGGFGQYAERVPPGMVKNTLTVGDIRKQLIDAGVDEGEIDANLDPDDQLFFFRPDFKTPTGEHIIRIYRNGERQLWKLSPELFDAMDTNARLAGDGFMEQAARWLQVDKATRLTRLGATGVNPAFTLTNLLRDLWTYWLQSKTKNVLRQTAAIPAAMARMFTHHIASIAGRDSNGIVDLFNKVGGSMTGRLGTDYAEMAQKVDQSLGDPKAVKALRIITSPRRSAQLIGHSLDFVKNVVNFTEAAPRIAEFTESLRRSGFTEADVKAGNVTREALIRAINDASDVTTNFRRAGTMGRAINQYVPFFNARVQGFDKMVRSIGSDPLLAAMRLTPMLALTALLWAMRKDDDEYKEEPDWLKFGFWNFTQNGRVVARIPRPHDWGWFFVSSFEAALDAIDKHDPKIVSDYLSALTDQLPPSFLPSGIKQAIETTFNVDLFRSNLATGELAPIEPRGSDRLKPWDRTDANTTMLARAIAQSDIGHRLGLSPLKLDHFLDGVTGGGVGRLARFASTFRSDFPKAVGDASLSGVTVRNDYMRSIDEFYRQAQSDNQAWNSSKIADEEGDRALGDRNHQMTWYGEIMSDLRDLVPPGSERDEKYAVNRYIAGLARQALGKEPLAQFPNPFASTDLPPEVAGVVRRARESLRNSAGINAQTASSRDRVRRARSILRTIR